MKTTLDLDEALLRRAAKLTGQTDATTLVQMGLEALVVQQVTRGLTALGRTDADATTPRRHRRWTLGRRTGGSGLGSP